VGFYDTPGMALDVDVAGSYAYLADDSSFRVVDVSNNAAPQEVGYYNTFCKRVQVVGNYAYTMSAIALRVIGVSNPHQPELIGYVPFNDLSKAIGGIEDLFVSGNYVYIIQPTPQGCERMGCYPGKLYVVDVSNPTSPQHLSSYEEGGSFYAIYVVRRWAFVTYAKNTIHGRVDLFDVSDPTHLSFEAWYQTLGDDAWDVYATDQFVYIADGEAGLTIWWYGPECASASELQAAAGHWKLSVGEPGYAPTYDRDQDDVISMTDIQDPARWWHPRCP
jgi:hypothetical protein